ncbi:MAG: hypothetical protein Ct9H300mP19_17030 [Dehalococcoidia bacterium]|nr:MAG: hypothetical protein Ct9H300mP19_17030 [Dehalococcoidia bacterium]
MANVNSNQVVGKKVVGLAQVPTHTPDGRKMTRAERENLTGYNVSRPSRLVSSPIYRCLVDQVVVCSDNLLDMNNTSISKAFAELRF